MENEVLTSLAHHGIKGQRWGIRRFQKKDGTLTPAGKKRYDSEVEKLKQREQVLKNKKRTQAKIDKLNAKKQALDEMENELSGKGRGKVTGALSKLKDKKKSEDVKDVKDMTDDELRQRIVRLQLEQQLKSLTPQQQTRGQRFVNNVLLPGISKVGKEVGNIVMEKGMDMLKQQLGLDGVDDALEALKKEANIAGLKKTIYDSEKSRLEVEDKKAKRNKNNNNNNNNNASKTFKFKKKPTPGSDDSPTETFEGVVIGPDNSKRYTARQTGKGKSFSFRHKKDPIYTDDWTDVTDRGTTYVNNLLNPPGLPDPDDR